MKPLLIGLLLAAQAQSPPEQEIIGYYHLCEAELVLASGKLTAGRRLTDDGSALYGSDSAHWIANNYGNPEPGLSINWFVWGHPPRKLSQIGGEITLFYDRQYEGKPKLPRHALWRFWRSPSRQGAALTTLISTQAEPRLGSARFALADLLAFAGDRKSLDWSYDRAPNGKGEFRSVATGSTLVEPLAEAARELSRVEGMLDRAAENFAQACQRHAIYYDPLSEI